MQRGTIRKHSPGLKGGFIAAFNSYLTPIYSANIFSPVKEHSYERREQKHLQCSYKCIKVNVSVGMDQNRAEQDKLTVPETGRPLRILWRNRLNGPPPRFRECGG